MTISDAVWKHPERVSGAVCFRGTRLPVQVLFEYLKAGQPVQDFLDDYPGPTDEQVEAVLSACQKLIDDGSLELLAA